MAFRWRKWLKPREQKSTDTADAMSVESVPAEAGTAAVGAGSSGGLAILGLGAGFVAASAGAYGRVSSQDDNSAPVGVDQSVQINAGTRYNGRVIATDADGDGLTYRLESDAPQGLTFNSNGEYQFDARAGFSALNDNQTQTVTLSYRANDGKVDGAANTISILVRGVDDAPTADAFTQEVVADELGVAYTGRLLANDAENEALHYFLVNTDVNPAPAGVRVSTDGVFTVDASAGDAGLLVGETRIVRFDYFAAEYDAATQQYGNTSDAISVTLTIQGSNHLPTAKSVVASAQEDEALVFDAASFLANAQDSDAEDTLSIVSVQNAKNGVVTRTQSGDIRFMPDKNYNGSDASFTYTVADNHGRTATAIVAITVNNVADVPEPTHDVLATNEDRPLLFTAQDLLANDTHGDGLALRLVSIDAASNGHIQLQADGSFLFIPTANFFGEASFSYTVTDGNTERSASVLLNIAAINDIPVIALAPQFDATPILQDDEEIVGGLPSGGQTLAWGDGSYVQVYQQGENTIFQRFNDIGQAIGDPVTWAQTLPADALSFELVLSNESGVLAAYIRYEQPTAVPELTQSTTLRQTLALESLSFYDNGTVADGVKMSASATLDADDIEDDAGALTWSISNDSLYGDMSITPHGTWQFSLNPDSILLRALLDSEVVNIFFYATVHDTRGAMASHEIVMSVRGAGVIEQKQEGSSDNDVMSALDLSALMVDGLYGHDGDDTLIGGAGDDYLFGGVGSDHYVYLMGRDGFDVIRDDSLAGSGDIDVLDIQGLDAAGLSLESNFALLEGVDLFIQLGASTDEGILLRDFFTRDEQTGELSLKHAIEEIRWADTQLLTSTDMLSYFQNLEMAAV